MMHDRLYLVFYKVFVGAVCRVQAEHFIRAAAVLEKVQTYEVYCPKGM